MGKENIGKQEVFIDVCRLKWKEEKNRFSKGERGKIAEMSKKY